MATDAVGEAAQCQEDLCWRKALTDHSEMKRRWVTELVALCVCQWSMISLRYRLHIFWLRWLQLYLWFKTLSTPSHIHFGFIIFIPIWDDKAQKPPLQVPLWALAGSQCGALLWDVHRSWGWGDDWWYSPERVDDHLWKENSPSTGWTEAFAWVPKLALMEAVLHQSGRFEAGYTIWIYLDIFRHTIHCSDSKKNFWNMSSINRRDRMTMWSLRRHACNGMPQKWKISVAWRTFSQGVAERLYWEVLVENVLQWYHNIK